MNPIIRGLIKEGNLDQVFSTFEQDSRTTKGAWVTLAANLSSIGNEHRANAKENERFVLVAALITALVCVVLTFAPNLMISPLFAVSLFAFGAYAVVARESSLKSALQCEKAAAVALGRASMTPSWKGSGIVTGWFQWLFSSNNQPVHSSDNRILRTNP